MLSRGSIPYSSPSDFIQDIVVASKNRRNGVQGTGYTRVGRAEEATSFSNSTKQRMMQTLWFTLRKEKRTRPQEKTERSESLARGLSASSPSK